MTTKVTLEGNFFVRDPGKTLATNVQHMVDALAPELEALVQADIEAHAGAMPHWTGFTRDHVRGYTTSPKTGKHWGMWAAVGLPTNRMDRKEAIRTKAAGASIERRFHPFRRVKSAAFRARALISADLTKGLE